MSHARFDIVTTTAGQISIRNLELGEIMHNPVGPWREANALYIEQGGLSELFASTAEVVVFDVGLGAAANALAAIHCLRRHPHARMKLISFERDLELAHFALANAGQFSHFSGYEPALNTLLLNKTYKDDQLEWHLREGDFLDQILDEDSRARIVFYDPYSQKVNREMWTTDCFRRLRRACDDSCLLLTYSQSTPVRVALLEAGFFVGRGLPTGLKEETTQAATRLTDLASPLGAAWLERWKKSHSKYPFGYAPERRSEIEELIIKHGQFNS